MFCNKILFPHFRLSVPVGYLGGKTRTAPLKGMKTESSSRIHWTHSPLRKHTPASSRSRRTLTQMGVEQTSWSKFSKEGTVLLIWRCSSSSPSSGGDELSWCSDGFSRLSVQVDRDGGWVHTDRLANSHIGDGWGPPVRCPPRPVRALSKQCGARSVRRRAAEQHGARWRRQQGGTTSASANHGWAMGNARVCSPCCCAERAGVRWFQAQCHDLTEHFWWQTDTSCQRWVSS